MSGRAGGAWTGGGRAAGGASRRYPDISWSWPRGDLDLLLRAAAHTDADAARTAFEPWLAATDIDALSFREHRLLAAIADRFGKALSHHPEYPRLVGLQRMMWTRSRMTIQAVLPVLRSMAAAGIDVMLLKGASRVALDAANQRQRIAYDVDVLVRPEQVAASLDMLEAGGWQHNLGVSFARLRATAKDMDGQNFLKGPFGDIDLHVCAYHPAHRHPARDAAIWDGARAADYLGVPAFVAAPEERIAMAIAHGAEGGHSQSDWLLDCAHTVAEEPVDWAQLLAILVHRNAVNEARIAVGYLADRLGCAIPQGFRDGLSRSVSGGLMKRHVALALAKPGDDWGWVKPIGHGIARRLHKRAVRDVREADAIRGKVRPAWTRPDGEATSVHVLAHPETAGRMICRLDLLVGAADVARKWLFEVNSNLGHVALLKARTHSSAFALRRMRFEFPVEVTSGLAALRVEGRALRPFMDREAPEARRRFEAPAFQVERVVFRPV